jgi:hypothetical protein
MRDITVIEVSAHRNGVGGEPFHAIRFLWSPDGNAIPEKFLAIVHDQPGYCSVIGLDRLEDMGVMFAGGNSWRGDHFEPFLRDAIEEHTRVMGEFSSHFQGGNRA